MNYVFHFYFFLFFLTFHSSISQDKKNLLNEIILTGQYSPTPSDSSIYKVKIISKKEIESRSAKNLTELLQEQIGINKMHDPFLGSQINFQGISGANIKILIDGIQMIGNQNETINLDQIDIQNIEKIEIIEGPLSVIYGNNALGSTINLITKKEQKEKISISTKYNFESIGQHDLNTQIGIKIKNGLFINSISRKFFDGWSSNDPLFDFSFKVPTNERNQDWKPKTQLFINSKYLLKKEKLTITPYFSFLDEKITNRGELLEGNWTQPHAIDDYYLTNRLNAGININGELLNRNINIIISNNNYQRVKNTYYKNLTTLEENLIETPNSQDTTKSNSWINRVTCANTFNQNINYQYGYEIFSESIQTKRILGDKKERREFSFFSSIELTLFKNILIRPAIRISQNNDYKIPIIPSVNLKYDLNSHILRFSYGAGFRSPSLKEMFFNFTDSNHEIIGNTNLEAENSKNFQFNWTKQITEKNKVGLDFFYNKINNLITLAQIEPINNQSLVYGYENIGRYKTIGGKLNYKMSSDKLNCVFDISNIGQKYNSNESFIFSSEVSMFIQYQVKKWHINFSYSFKGKKDNFYINSFGELMSNRMNSFNLLDLSFKRSFYTNQLNLKFGVKNILNVKEVEGANLINSFHGNNSGNMLIGCGRYIFSSIEFNFKK